MRSSQVNRLLQSRRPPAHRARRPPTVLVVEERPATADHIAAQLQGQRTTRVLWCRGADGRVTCDQVASATCPLMEDVDLVLDVRTGGTERLTGDELGVACAAVAGIPVVAAAPLRPTRSEAPWAVATCTLDEAADFCSSLLDNPDPWQEQRLEDLVRRIVAMREGGIGEVAVDLVRWPEAVTVVIRTQRRPSADTCAAIDAAVRAIRPPIAPDGVAVGLSFSTSVHNT